MTYEIGCLHCCATLSNVKIEGECNNLHSIYALSPMRRLSRSQQKISPSQTSTTHSVSHSRPSRMLQLKDRTASASKSPTASQGNAAKRPRSSSWTFQLSGDTLATSRLCPPMSPSLPNRTSSPKLPSLTSGSLRRAWQSLASRPMFEGRKAGSVMAVLFLKMNAFFQEAIADVQAAVRNRMLAVTDVERAFGMYRTARTRRSLWR